MRYNIGKAAVAEFEDQMDERQEDAEHILGPWNMNLLRIYH